MKKFFALLLIIIFVFSFTLVYSAPSAVDKIIEEDNFVILATIIEIDNNTIELSKEYEIYPKDSNLPSTLKVDKFKYSYCEEHSKSYNTPQIGDNIIIKIQYNNNKFTANNGAFKIDTVSHKTLKVFVPNEMKDYECAMPMLALAHYIRTDGAQTEYKYDNDEVISKLDNKVLNAYEADYIAYYSNNSDTNANSGIISYIQTGKFTDSAYFELIIISSLTILLVLGAFAVYTINKKIMSK